MKRVLVVLVALAGCQKTDPLFCPMHLDSCLDGGVPLGDGVLGVSIGGHATGLTPAMGLLLENNGGDDLQVATDGVFVFPTPIAINTAYSVTVATQPTQPSEMCTVTMGSGTAAGDVQTVQVTCEKQSYNVGGTVGGLNSGTQVGLHADYGTTSDNTTVGTNGLFHFPNMVQSGTNYTVMVTTQPASGGPCNVFGGGGTVGNSDVTSILVNCNATLYAIGGSVSGLNGTVVLKNNTNGNTVSISANGSYAFPMPVSGPYNVTVMTQPMSPVQQTCAVANGSGTANTNVSNINVSCTTDRFTIGGNVSGLTGGSSVKLKDNGADQITVSSNTGFTFPTSISSGAGYNVTVSQNPSGETCKVSSGAGQVTNANITNVAVACGVNDPGIACGDGTMFCNVSNQVCCGIDTTGTGSTCTSMPCMNAAHCDDAADCSGGKLCCAATHGSHLDNTTCQTSCSGPQLCDPNVAGSCASGSCSQWGSFPNYNICQ